MVMKIDITNPKTLAHYGVIAAVVLGTYHWLGIHSVHESAMVILALPVALIVGDYLSHNVLKL